MDYFKHILEKNSNNIYAANGIAAIMAELGDIEPAQKIFNQVTTIWFDVISCVNPGPRRAVLF